MPGRRRLIGWAREEGGTNVKGKEMDNLTRDAIAAQRAGMTYGKYMAMRDDREQKMPRQRTRPEVELRKKFNPNPKIPVKVCGFCGKEFPTAGRSVNCKYCGLDCANMANKVRSREYTRKKRALKAET